eukprot:scaffold21169_cov125-Isochrysis_galbana.AAC.1
MPAFVGGIGGWSTGSSRFSLPSSAKTSGCHGLWVTVMELKLRTKELTHLSTLSRLSLSPTRPPPAGAPQTHGHANRQYKGVACVCGRTGFWFVGRGLLLPCWQQAPTEPLHGRRGGRMAYFHASRDAGFEPNPAADSRAVSGSRAGGRWAGGLGRHAARRFLTGYAHIAISEESRHPLQSHSCRDSNARSAADGTDRCRGKSFCSPHWDEKEHPCAHRPSDRAAHLRHLPLQCFGGGRRQASAHCRAALGTALRARWHRESIPGDCGSIAARRRRGRRRRHRLAPAAARPGGELQRIGRRRPGPLVRAHCPRAAAARGGGGGRPAGPGGRSGGVGSALADRPSPKGRDDAHGLITAAARRPSVRRLPRRRRDPEVRSVGGCRAGHPAVRPGRLVPAAGAARLPRPRRAMPEARHSPPGSAAPSPPA